VLVAVALCAVVLLPRVQLRPHLLAWVLLGLLLVLQRRKSAVGTAAVLAVWANCHASFVLGVAMNVLANLGSHAESGRKRTLLACLASVAAPLLNPYGPAIYGFGSIIKDDVWFVSEWQPFQADAPYLWVFVALAGFVALDAVRRRQHRWLDLARVALLAGLSATAMRHTAEAALFLCPIVAVRLGSLLEAAPRWANAAACGAAAVLAVGMTVHLAVTRRPFRFTVDQFALPVAATSFIVRHDLQGRMFNDYNFGGYLLWRAWPRHRVFVDGRLEVYGPRGVLRDYLVASSGSPGAEAVLDKYGVAFAVVRPDRALAHALADDRDWELVYFDYNAAVFVRRGTNRELRRLRLLTPWGNRDRRMVAASIDEARYLLRENPWFFGGHKILAFLLYRTGDNRGAAEELRRYLDLWPQGRENVETKEMIGALARRDAWDR
jgi:hypothetical protein